jgi:hypothetical protein
MIDAAQIILDVTAIATSIYTLRRVYDSDKIANTHALFIGNLQNQTLGLSAEIKRVEGTIPKEVIASGIEPGIYLPRENKDNPDVVDMVKSMDLNDWKDLVSKVS